MVAPLHLFSRLHQDLAPFAFEVKSAVGKTLLCTFMLSG